MSKKTLTQKEKILYALRTKNRTSIELNKITIKYTQRISDLRKDGHTIVANTVKRKGKVMNWKEYELII